MLTREMERRVQGLELATQRVLRYALHRPGAPSRQTPREPNEELDEDSDGAS
jgi:hypothetical protein